MSILAGAIINKSGRDKIERYLPPVVTGSVAVVIGIALAGAAMDQAAGNWTLSIVTLLATILFSVCLRGTLGQLPGTAGRGRGLPGQRRDGRGGYSAITEAAAFSLPHFTFPKWPCGHTGHHACGHSDHPESTAHLYQIDHR